MKRVERTYIYKDVRISFCDWCNGTGLNRTFHKPCFACDGQGGEWERKKFLVKEKVVE